MKFKDPTYIGDPINAVRIFNEKEVDELVFLDITVSAEGGIPALKIIQEVAEECFMPLAYGGGLTSQEQIRSVFNLGVEKAVICTAAIKNPEFVQRAADTFGSQSITICLDYRRNLFGQCEVWTHSGMRNTKLEVVKMADRMQAMGAGELILNSIDRDGTMQGYDLDLLQKVCQAVEIPVVASGGAGRLEHFREAVNVGASAVAAGSMFVFHGRHRAVLISYPTSKELSSILP